MEKNKNKRKCKYEFYIPMGTVGSLVIKAPVVLSKLKISIPICTNIDLSTKCSDINTISNEVFLSKPKMDCNDTLFIDGYIDKKVGCKDKCIYTCQIPICDKIPIDFSVLPAYKKEIDDDIYYEKSPSPISFTVDYIKIRNDRYKVIDGMYVNSMIICIELTLTQIQYVFIPEPEGDVFLLPNSKTPPIQEYIPNEDFYYTVGNNKSTGLVAEKHCKTTGRSLTDKD